MNDPSSHRPPPLISLSPLPDATRDSYDRFAPRYADLYFETRGLDREMGAFLRLLPPAPLLLDAGCGPGHLAHFFARNGARPIGLDYSHSMLLEGHRRGIGIPLIQGDLTALPFTGHAFHGIWARASLIHLDAAAHQKTLSEFHRTLRPSGLLYAAVREGTGEETRIETQGGVEVRRFFRFWSADQWRDALLRAGFDVLERGTEPGDPENWLWLHARKRPR